MKQILHNILVDLDCIVDTRLSTIHLINKELPEKLLNNGYYDRLSDEMDGLLSDEERKIYQHRYKNRADNPKTLQYALPTNMNQYITDFYHGYTADQLVATSGNRPTCTINTYPYFLTDDQIELIKHLLIPDLYAYCDITTKRIDMSSINIESMVSNFSEYITYESNGFINNWLTNYDDFVSPGFKIILPKLAIGNKSMIGLSKDDNLTKKRLYDIIEAIRTSCSGIFYLGFLHPYYYSPRKKPQ